MAQKTLTQPTVQTIEEQSIFNRLYWNISDTLVMTRRNLVYYVREPELLVFATIQPIMFLLLFVYVFGGAIQTPDGNYINYLLPGIIVQTVIFGATQTTVGLADDLSKGMIDRFRSLPMARSGVLAGRTLADNLRSVMTITNMIIIGTLIGFRFEGGLLSGVAGVAVAVMFGYAFTWISAFIGLFVKSPEAAQVAGFIWVFPLVFASSIFVPPETMPDWLRAFADNQPITAVANAVRGLFSGTATVEIVVTALVWIFVISAIFVPLSIWQYKKR